MTATWDRRGGRQASEWLASPGQGRTRGPRGAGVSRDRAGNEGAHGRGRE